MKSGGESLSESKRALLQKYSRVREETLAQATAIPRRPAEEPSVLSFGQQQIWLHSQTSETPFYNETMAVYHRGALDVPVLERSLLEIIRRHELWRTAIVVTEGEPSPVVQPVPSAIPLPVLDLTLTPEAERDAEAVRAAGEHARHPFDLKTGPLLRFLLVSMGEQEHRLYMALHHLIFDAVSAYRVFLPELVTIYEAFVAGRPHGLPELRIQYADFAHWQRRTLSPEALSKDMSYWRTQLAGELPVCHMPADRPRPPVETHHGATQRFALPVGLIDFLRSASQQAGVSLYMSLLAGLAALLYRYTGQDEVIIGSLSGDRPQEDLETMMGYFVNPIALRIDISGNPSFRELQLRVRDVVLDALDHAKAPFADVVREVQRKHDPSRNPIFQIVLSQQPPFPAIAPGWDLVTEEVSNGGSKFDLLMVIDDRGETVTGPVTYNPDLFDAGTIKRMADHWYTLLDAACRDPELRISSLPILTEAERIQILDEWNETKTDYPDACVHSLFEQQASRVPDRVAVVYEGRQLSYGDLNRQANQLARHLQELGVGPEVLVGLCVERSLEMVVGILAILKAGGAYVPLDPAYPKDRLAFMLEDAKVSVLLAQERLIDKLPSHGANIVCLDRISEQISGLRADNLHGGTTPDSLAYVMYTSGSTGRPKGVSIVHRGIVRLVRNTNFVDLSEDEVFLQFSAISFDVSTFEIWGSLLNGAKLVVFPAHTPSFKELGLAFQQYQITTLWLTAALFHQMAEDHIESFGGIRQMLAGGDVLSVPHVKKFLEAWPNCPLINGYGPTENTTFTSYYRMTAPEQVGYSVSIGRPLANTQTYILDAHLNPVPVGVSGELYTGGAGLARGYFNRPELTAEKFIASPFDAEPGARLYRTGDLCRYLADGNIEFLGRMDHQLKIRGFRIELGEIESVLCQHSNVGQAIVVAREDAVGDKRLVAYVTVSDAQTTAQDLRAFSKTLLPDYMVPADFVFLDTLPLTPNGKVDRKALPEPDANREDSQAAFVPPRSLVQRQLTEEWETLLGKRPISMRENFFDLGGHSLLAVRLIARIEKRFGKNLPVAALFQSPTIEQLAGLLEQADLPDSWSSLVPVQLDGSSLPFFWVHGDLSTPALPKYLGSDQPVYGLDHQSQDGKPALYNRVENIAEYYLKEVRTVRARGPYFLGGYCFGAAVAFEMAQQLRAEGEEVAFLFLLDPPAATTVKVRPPVRSKVDRHIRNLKLLGTRQKLNYVLLRARKMVRDRIRKASISKNFKKLRGKTYLALGRRLPPSLRSSYILAIYEEALLHYLPEQYTGPATLFTGEGRTYRPFLDWPTLVTGKLEICEGAGDHTELIREPFISVWAGELRQQLHKAQIELSGKRPRER